MASHVKSKGRKKSRLVWKHGWRGQSLSTMWIHLLAQHHFHDTRSRTQNAAAYIERRKIPPPPPPSLPDQQKTAYSSETERVCANKKKGNKKSIGFRSLPYHRHRKKGLTLSLFLLQRVKYIGRGQAFISSGWRLLPRVCYLSHGISCVQDL